VESFTKLEGVAASLSLININTDLVIPKEFLKTITRKGLGNHLFSEMRYDPNGNPVASFVLNIRPWNNAVILVTSKNFGCGSSREHAVWSLVDFGIRCVIAPSFADIFFSNCFKNGVLPIVLPEETVCELSAQAGKEQTCRFNIDLASQTIKDGKGEVIVFDVDAFSKDCLLNGYDDIDLTLQCSQAIDDFEARDMKLRSWM
jgi:3-isopropylmalate/(R)-2-methylmalate dehydratase small subunit